MTLPGPPALHSLHAALHQALRDAGHPSANVPLQSLPDQGLAHSHVALGATGLLARVPKQSQIGLDAADHLAYEAACFMQAGPSGHVPRLHGVLPPSPALPRGALLVDHVQGRPLRLPDELPRLIDALAALHRLPLPAPAQRAPLLDPADPLAALADELQVQVSHLPAAGIGIPARRVIDAAFERWQRLCAQPLRPPKRLIAFDAHPGNFLVDAHGRAVLVDLEKARYGAAPLDLAHATLYTSTTWDRASRAELSTDQTVAAAERWMAAVRRASDPMDTFDWRPWIVPLREAMWLWAVTWCAKWRVLSRRPAAAGGNGEDWSAEHSAADLVAHVRGRVDEYLSEAIVSRVADECSAMRQRFGAVN